MDLVQTHPTDSTIQKLSLTMIKGYAGIRDVVVSTADLLFSIPTAVYAVCRYDRLSNRGSRTLISNSKPIGVSIHYTKYPLKALLIDLTMIS